MAAADVVACLQALEVPSLGLSAGERKARLRGEIGLATEERGGGVAAGAGKGGEEGEGGKRKMPTPAEKARTNTENAKKAAEVRRKVLEAKRKKAEAEAEGGKK